MKCHICINMYIRGREYDGEIELFRKIRRHNRKLVSLFHMVNIIGDTIFILNGSRNWGYSLEICAGGGQD
jgi:hypothetical protein